MSHNCQFISAISSKILAIEDKQLYLFEGSYEVYINRSTSKSRDLKGEQLMKIEMGIIVILSQLSD